MSFTNNILSAKDFNIEHVLYLFDSANKDASFLTNRIIGIWFQQPSTRTRLSFQTATFRYGGNVIEVGDDQKTSIAKGETIEDTMRMLNNYCDALVVRNSNPWHIRYLSSVANIPLINAGNGDDEHPTQALADVYQIWKQFPFTNSLAGLNIVIVGNTSRTIRSFCFLLSKICINCHFYFVVNKREVADKDVQECLSINNFVHVISNISSVGRQNTHIVYANRDANLPKKNTVTLDYVDNCVAENGIILHPLPRVVEISEEVDENPKARYFQQAADAVYLRARLLGGLLKHD